LPTPYGGREFIFSNPDGSRFPVRGFGNQFAAVFETLDGFTVVKAQSGFYHYATVTADGTRLEPTGPVVGAVHASALDLPKHARPAPQAAREDARSAIRATGVTPRWAQRRRARKPRSPAPPLDPDEEADRGLAARTVMAAPDARVVGSYVGLCLLVSFPDLPEEVPSAEVTQYCNTAGYTGFGNKGSVRDYFKAVSDGRLDYTNVVTEYFTAKHERDYYTDPAVEQGIRAQQLIREGLKHLKAVGFDFEQLTADTDGFVRALNVFHAGPTANDWAEGLWPHSGALAKPFVASDTRSFSDYQITSIGSELTLRTFCHENGHMICDFPDLYDYGYESNGVGDYCLMCGGGSDTNPVHVCAYLKHQAGWASKVTEVRPGDAYEVDAASNDFLIHRRSRTEYFIIENRRRTRRDASLPDAGIAIWHADETGSNDNEAMEPAEHYECSLEQADGRFDLERGVNDGDTGDLFAGPGRRTFGAAGVPDSRWWDGTPSGLEVVDVSKAGSTMTITTGKQPRVALANLKFGVRANADVRKLQSALNAHFRGLDLPTTGNYLALTDAAVRRCQRTHGFGADAPKKSFVGKRQAAHLGLLTVARRARQTTAGDTQPTGGERMTEDLTTAGQNDDAEVEVTGTTISDGAYTLFVADFSDTATAWDAYEQLKAVEDGATFAVESVVVVNRDAEGKLHIQKATDHSTSKGLKWGVVGGVVLGVIFPPSILGSAAALGAIGAATGKARELHHRSELADELERAIEPGHSGIVALVSDPGAVEIRNALAAANAIVSHAVDKVAAKDIKAAADQSDDTGETPTAPAADAPASP